MEIERKFLINNLPFILEDYPCSLIEQGYISTTPVIRVRKKALVVEDKFLNPKYILTVKSKGLMVRQEYELDLDESEYESLLKKCSGNVITKKRYVIPLEDNLSLELDIFEGAFEGLIMGEIEFPDEASSKKYNPPEYLFREVTFDTNFHNSTMSNMSKEQILNLIASINSYK